MKQDSVVALVPVLETSPHVVLGGAGLEAHEGVWEIIFGQIVLRREVVSFRLAALAHQLSLSVALVHVMRDGPHVVEEFAEQIPAALAFHHLGAQQQIARMFDGVFQREIDDSNPRARSSGPHLRLLPGRSKLWWWSRTSAR